MRPRRWWWVTAAILAGCSSGLDSGVQGDKPVSAITTAEATQFCEATRDYLQGRLSRDQQDDIYCTGQALGMTSNPDDCAAMRSACLAGPIDITYIDESFDCSGAGPVDGCDATVDSVESCYTADIELYIDRLAMIDCSIAGNIPALEELQEPLPVPSECTSAGAMACPFLEDGLIGR